MRQLADYQAHLDDLKAAGASVVGVSTDPEEKARETVEQNNLTFPVLYGLQVPRDADPIGARYEEKRGIFHATAYILNPERKVAQACYSTGPIGRIVAEDAIGSIKFAQKMAAQQG